MNHDAPAWPGHCFGCSPRNALGLHLHFEKTAGGCRADHAVPPHFCGVDGVVHGGIVSTLLDEAGAWALILHLGKLGLTTEMNARFLQPVRTARPLVMEAWIEVREGRRAATRAELRDPAGTVLATCEARWALASAAVVARMSGLPRDELEDFFSKAAGA